MVKGKQQTTNTTAKEMKEMRTQIEKLFGELNARQDMFDQSILELKESIDSSTSHQKVGKQGNSYLLQEENMKGSEKSLTASEPNEKQGEGLCNKKKVSLSKDDSKYVVDVPTVDVGTLDMAISLDAVVEYSQPLEYSSGCVTGYHGKLPLIILIGVGGSTHNFIDESLADKLGCDTFPIKPRTVNTFFGNMMTSRACKNFELTLQGTLFSLDLYLVPMSSNCDMVFGGQWERMIEKYTYGREGVEFYFQGKNHLMPFTRLGNEASHP